MYIQLFVDNEKFLYEVSSFEELRARTLEHLGPLLSSTSLRLVYRVPLSPHSTDTSVVPVNSEVDFQVSIQVWDDSIRPLQLSRQEPLLPTYEAMVDAAVPIASPVAQSAIAAINKSVRKRTPALSASADGDSLSSISTHAPSSFITPKKSSRAPAPTSDTPESAVVVIPEPVAATSKNGFIDTDWYRSHDKANTLLSSFQPSSPQECPTIRITLRAGQASARVRFDPYNRPDINELRTVAQAELLRRLSSGEKEAIMEGTSSGTIKFLLYVNTPSTPVDIDVEDNADVAFVCDEIKKFGNDYSVQLICEWIDSTEVPCAREEIRLVETDLVEVVLPPRSALTFNLAHTPKREHHEPKSVLPDD